MRSCNKNIGRWRTHPLENLPRSPLRYVLSTSIKISYILLKFMCFFWKSSSKALKKSPFRTNFITFLFLNFVEGILTVEQKYWLGNAKKNRLKKEYTQILWHRCASKNVFKNIKTPFFFAFSTGKIYHWVFISQMHIYAQIYTHTQWPLFVTFLKMASSLFRSPCFLTRRAQKQNTF